MCYHSVNEQSAGLFALSSADRMHRAPFTPRKREHARGLRLRVMLRSWPPAGYARLARPDSRLIRGGELGGSFVLKSNAVSVCPGGRKLLTRACNGSRKT